MKYLLVAVVTALIVITLTITGNLDSVYSQLNPSTPISSNDASVINIDDMGVFILASSKKSYSELGEIKSDLVKQMGENTDGKNWKNIVSGLITTTTNNVDFTRLISRMVKDARQQYPDADAIIFEQSLSSCKVIQFN